MSIAQKTALSETISVSLGQNSYDILIGKDLLAGAGDHLCSFIKDRQIIIISDTTVAGFHLSVLAEAVRPLARSLHHFSVPPGEASKSFAVFEKLVNDILALPIDRHALILAFGGGVIGDLAGFAAASLLRGIDFIQIPTSLLAQVDSSVGGKTGINSPAGKNLVGAFYQPRRVLADISLLATLPMRELRAGYAEIVKYGLLGDARFFDWLEANHSHILAGDSAALIDAVRHSCQMKADIVAEDERESGRRALLNLGHTFAHAFEAEAGYDGRLLHGEAVAAGLGLAFGFSRWLGLATGQDEMRVITHLKSAGLPSGPADLPAGTAPAERLVSHMHKDKKARAGKLTFILVRAIGDAFVEHQVDENQLRAFLETC